MFVPAAPARARPSVSWLFLLLSASDEDGAKSWSGWRWQVASGIPSGRTGTRTRARFVRKVRRRVTRGSAHEKTKLPRETEPIRGEIVDDARVKMLLFIFAQVKFLSDWRIARGNFVEKFRDPETKEREFQVKKEKERKKGK